MVLKFGVTILKKLGPQDSYYLSPRIRQLVPLVLVLCKRVQRNEANLEEFIDTAYFDTIEDAVCELCNFDLESH